MYRKGHCVTFIECIDQLKKDRKILNLVSHEYNVSLHLLRFALISVCTAFVF